MSTATAITVQVQQKRLARFLREFATPVMHLFVRDGFVCLSDQECDAILLLGEHPDRAESFEVNLHKSAFAKWVRAAGTTATIELSVSKDSLTATCDKLGSMDFHTTDPTGVRTWRVAFREVVGKITLPDVRSALRVASHTDPESVRLALGNVKLDGGKAVATNGKSLATCDVEFDGDLLIPAPALKWADYANAPVYAIKAGESDTVFLAGDLVCVSVDGRFPNWRQVIPTGKGVADSFVVDAAELRKRIDRWRASIKAGAIDTEAMEFNIRPDVAGASVIAGWPIATQATASVTALLSCELLHLCIPKRGEVTFRMATQEPAKHPFVVEADTEPGLVVVVMPMWKEAASAAKK